jgi:hypothetical protein
MNFKDLTDERRRVQHLCRKHAVSLSAFKFLKGASFSLFWEDASDPDETEIRHLTSTATCIESLIDCHPTTCPPGSLNKIAEAVHGTEDSVVDLMASTFYAAAARRETRTWMSEESAPVYCASRALPIYLKGTKTWTPKHSELVAQIFEQCNVPDRFGIGERNTTPGKRGPVWYPENAYHTYWASTVLRIITNRFEAEAQDAIKLNLVRLRHGLRLWSSARLTEEIALHWAESAALDSDQLTWALATFIEFGEELSSNLRSQDLIRRAFDALARTQEPVGTWRHYRPLFVYSNSGNAYCYVYESFTYLLKAVLKKISEEDFLEDVARKFVDSLSKLTAYAEMTQVQHPNISDAIGWSSGHRPAETKTEGWATASVFSYLQSYRRLLGILAGRDAIRALPSPPLAKHSEAMDLLIDRGETWPAPGLRSSVAEDLISLFINPILMSSRPELSEPDDQPIRNWQARSAILFGPPGASKTTLARSVATSLGWKYVELHSSHFVAEGIQAVQRTADGIFAHLMELDHTVVLFDEPDELVRERAGAADAFGRFLTTSMLPKLAELWKQRRVIYFVATNHIEYFDEAIIRSERFDVLVFVPPPSFEKKIKTLQEHLGGVATITVTQAEIDAELSRIGKYSTLAKGEDVPVRLPDECLLAKFVLLRFDQLDELAFHLRPTRLAAIEVDAERLRIALGKISDHRLDKMQAYLDYLENARYSRRDFQRKPVYSVTELPDGSPIPEVEHTETGVWLKCKTGLCPDTLGGYRVMRASPGAIRILV